MKYSIISLTIFSLLISSNMTQASDKLFNEMDLNTGNTCPIELEKAKNELAAYKERLVPLRDRLASCRSELDRKSQPNPELERLLGENKRLERALSKRSQTSKNYAALALQYKELEGQKESLESQLRDSKLRNQGLSEQLGSLKEQLANTRRGGPNKVTARTESVREIPVPKSKPKKEVRSGNGKIVGQLLSSRRETNISRNIDQLVIGLSLTNTTNKPIYGVLVGPEITAIDSANNMFSNNHVSRIKGITQCQHGGKLYNTMNWCEGQINKQAISTTSFRPGVPVNVLVTAPAINADPDKKSDRVSTTLFLLLEGKEKGTFEKYPVDIQ